MQTFLPQVFLISNSLSYEYQITDEKEKPLKDVEEATTKVPEISRQESLKPIVITTSPEERELTD